MRARMKALSGVAAAVGLVCAVGACAIGAKQQIPAPPEHARADAPASSGAGEAAPATGAVTSASSSGAGSVQGVVVAPRRPGAPPPSDPRTVGQRADDIAAWDQCVLGAQSLPEKAGANPVTDPPEVFCAKTLGMADRSAVPIKRQQR